MKKVLSWMLLWGLCALAGFVSLLVMPASALFGSGGKARRLTLAYDQLGNAATGGDEDETISSRCWRYRERQPYTTLCGWIDKAFLRLDGESDHCRSAFEAERLKRFKRFKRK